MESLIHFVRRALIGLVLLFVLGVLAVAGVIYYFAQDLPQLDSLKDYNPPVVSEVYDDSGKQIGEFWTEKRYLLKPEELPKTVIQAVVASEDDRFWDHRGLDYQGIIRAFIENLKAGHAVQGGSTITQQVTRSLLLSREKKLSRKIKEAILATKIERNLNKDEILYLYLNQIFLGNRAYGIEAAARNYFHKTAKELNIAEAAMIAGLAKGPSMYSPTANPKLAKSRQEYVIGRMQEVGYINKEQAKRAREFPLTIYRAKTDKERNLETAPWFIETVRQNLQKKYGEQSPYTEGFQVFTTVDLQMQKAADAAVQRGLRELDQRQGYSGVVTHVEESQWDEFLRVSHHKLVASHFWNENVYSSPDPKTYVQLPTPIDENKYYQALITDVTSKPAVIEVKIGNQVGKIMPAEFAWVHKRNTNQVGYNEVVYLRDPTTFFKKGDVVMVLLKIPSEDEVAKKGYTADNTYFSLEQIPKAESALYSYEPQSGFVRAMVGGRDFAQSEFNRTYQALRQTGSTIKPLIYGSALDKGYNPNTIIEDSPLTYEVNPGQFWSPQNYGGKFSGPSSFRSCLVNSKNVPTVRILMDIGTHYFTGYVRKLGVTTSIQKYFSMALGANDMRLTEISRAYGTFATGGIVPEIVMIKRLVDKHGKVLEEYIPKQVVPFQEQLQKTKEVSESQIYNEKLWQEAQPWIESDKLKLSDRDKRLLYGDYIPEGYSISPRSAYTMVSIMQDIVNFGTGYKVKELKRPAAGKTGTTNDETDTWFLGFVPDLFAGVWVGFDQVQKIGGKETGGKTAAPIFLYYMQEVLKNKPVAEFQIPPEINQSALDSPLNLMEDDAEAGGVPGNNSGSSNFFLNDL